MEVWMEARSLSHSGLGIRAIARKLKIARGTVRRILRGENPAEKKSRPSFESLSPYREEMVRMLKLGLIGTRILHELRKAGYTGGKTPFYEVLVELKKTVGVAREKATVRFETQPGAQAQFDWSVYHIPFGDVLTRIVVYDLILAYSRRKFFWPSLRETQEAVFEALEQGFAHFGGVPHELLTDNPKAFVSDARPSHFTWNPQFLSLCKYYRVVPKACRVRRPQTKGKVERPFFVLEQHFIKGREFLSFDDFARKLSGFVAELDTRAHHDLGETPLARFEEEKEMLLPLPPEGVLGKFTLFRKVSYDCLISFENCKYSVPFAYAGKEVCLRASQGVTLEIFSLSGERIATHKLTAKKGSVVIEGSHYEGLRKQSPRSLFNLKRVFLEEFPEDALFLEKLLARYKWRAHRDLAGILDLLRVYPKTEIRKAFGLALTYNTFSLAFVRGVLQKQSPLKMEEASICSMVAIPEIRLTRDLADYARFLPEKGDG